MSRIALRCAHIMEKPPRIVIASGNHLCSNPRVVKEADTLSAAGLEVVVLGGVYVDGLKQRDLVVASGRKWSYQVAYDLTRSASVRLGFKVQRRLGLLLWETLGLANPWQIFYGTGSLRRAVKRLDADLTIAHWEAALPAVMTQLRRGRRVGVDMEDWFSEDLLPRARKRRPIRLLKHLEKRLLCEGTYSSCTSEAMADALMKEYGCRRPVVVRNVFPIKDREGLDGKWKDRPDMTKLAARNSAEAFRPQDVPVSIHWFSQTIGPGRGLEKLLAAAAQLRGNFEIHLRGDIRGYEVWFDQLIGARVRSRTRLHPVVTNEEVLSRIAEHDVSFAGERCEPPSRNLTITNKFFQYLQGGVAVVATNTAGQREAAGKAPGAVSLVKEGDVEELRAALQELIDDRGKLTAMRAAAWEAGGRLCWENEAPKLASAVERALGK